MQLLTISELNIEAGINWWQVGGGAAAVLEGLAIVAAPEVTLPTLGAAYLMGGGGAILIGSGLH